MSRPKLAARARVVITARKLKDLAILEEMPYRTAQKRKDLFALVEIPMGKKTIRRYLDKKTTDLLRASGLFTS